MTGTIIDSHAHIDQLEDISAAMRRADEAGVSDIIAVSVDLGSMQKVLGLAGQYQKPNIHPALGIHPGMVKQETQPMALEFMRAHVGQARAIGETGLDYWYKWVRKDLQERQKQKDSFGIHLSLAKEFDLPIIIHSRGAWRDCLAMAMESQVKGALFHWYSGPLDILDQILEAGFYVSTSPSVSYSPESRIAMAHAPLEKILIETDSPVSYRLNADMVSGDKEGEYFSAEPKDVRRTLKALSQLKNIDEQELLNTVNTNARAFFRI